ncbi:hypothetical protein RHMOL_Rhmol12G0043000 [Rhododendron molle]|uniref:Uncharacterized protein n=1 Tax=Rhododendron molle TaxID=49168 RepID=A0ACC0LE43_RHOML|nr:hypothetical protein RHMOL_Rhmol12G0043000 [Rhododendron molle]
MAGRRDEDMAGDPWVYSNRVLYKCVWVKFLNRYEIYVLISLLESPIKVSCRGMGSALYLDINVHFDGKVSRIKNIEPHKYGYMDLLDDVSSRSFNHLPSDRGFTIKMYGYKPGSNERMDVSSDLDVIEMFGFYCNVFVLDLHIEPFDPTKCGEEFQVDARGKIRLAAASRIQLYRAKRKALKVIEGNHSDSYPLLTTYALEVRKSNPGSLVKIQCDRLTETHNPVFKRYFICFEAMRTGFMEGCRPFIGIDGCHLKGPFGGVLLAVVALDGNNGLFPIAVGVVESEGRDSWAFFIDHLHTVIGAGTHARAWTFMSDQQKAARAYNELEFGYAMESIKSISVAGHKWLSEVPTVWSRHAFNEAIKNDHITNNLAESFNHWVGPLRFKPVLTMLEGIRTKLMTRLQKRHAATALTHKRANLEDYCDMYFHKDYYLKAHGGIIHPVPDQTRWINVGGDTVEPPPLKRLPGRPRKSRRRNVDEPEAGTSSLEGHRQSSVQFVWSLVIIKGLAKELQ